MKKYIVLSIIFFCRISALHAQVQWAFTAKKIAEKTYEIHCTATIPAGWHTYSQTTPDGGPVPTSFAFAANPLLTLDGKPKEVGKLDTHHEPLFGVDVKQFSGAVDFVQVIKLKAAVKTTSNT